LQPEARYVVSENAQRVDYGYSLQTEGDDMSFNKITMVGNVGRDPELRRLSDGATVCNFNLAVNETTRDRKSSATWFRITVWGERAAICARNL